MGVKRYAILALVTAGLCCAAVSAATASASAPGATTASGTAKAKLMAFVCQTARDPATRGVSVTAVMRPLPHTLKMALRFDLLVSRQKGAPGQLVRGRDLSKWVYPTVRILGQRPGDIWKLAHPVSQLSIAPAYYRFRVSFRWTCSGGKVLGDVVRYSPSCFQPELRPDVRVAGIQVKPTTKPNRDLYSALIKNSGGSAVGSFAVQFSDGTLVRSKTVPGLAAHSRTIVSFVGPLCDPSAPPTITADPSGEIPDDLNRANNSLIATCPTPSASPAQAGHSAR